MTLRRTLSEYRWPIFIGGHLTMSLVACGVLVYVATRPDVPRPIAGYYESARSWDADRAVEDASRALGWTVRFALPADVPHLAGMPRPVDVTVVDRGGRPVDGLAGQLVAIRPADARLNQRADLVAVPRGGYRTLVRLDEPGAWDLRLETQQHGRRFVLTTRFTVPGGGGAEGR
jgi:nitrogen fixation protein FixH